MKYYSPYGSFWPYGDPHYYLAVQEEKRQIRKEANRLGWTAFLGLFLMITMQFELIHYFRMMQPIHPGWEDFAGINPVLYYLISSLSYVLALAVPVLLYFALRRVPLSVGLPFGKVSLVKTLALVFVGIAGCMLANIPANIVINLERFFGFSGEIPDTPLNDDPVVQALYVLNIVVIPPIVEEMMFRGMILQGLRRFGDGFAVVASAALFGLFHGNFAQTVFAFLCGLVLGFVVIRTNSLLPSILIHALNNGTSVLIELVERYCGSDTAVAVSNIETNTLLVLGLISLVYLWIKDRKLFRTGASASPLRFSQKLGALFSNFGVIVIVIYSAVFSLYYLTQY